MNQENRIVECVPNFSEGRDMEKINAIVQPFKTTPGVRLVNCEPDKDYNRVVVTVLGEPEAVKESVIEAVGIAAKLIDLNNHTGQHQRMGATDVVPYIPIKHMTMKECIELAKETAQAIASRYSIPVFLYEKAAAVPVRENLAEVRKGQFEGMAEKLQLPEWGPDYGDRKIHPTAGVTGVCARMPLVAYNIDLDTADVEVANKIAKVIRHSNGGFRYIKAGGVYLAEKGTTQVTMNITDYTKTSIYRVFETVKMEAERFGVRIIGSEIVGLVPVDALVDSAMYYLKLNTFTKDKLIESNLE